MNPLPTPPDMTPEEFVSVTLRQCALILDPQYGRLTAVAEFLEVHETTVRVWIRNGLVPHKHCYLLLKRFGKKWIDFDRLVGENNG